MIRSPAGDSGSGSGGSEHGGLRARALYDYQAGKSLLFRANFSAIIDDESTTQFQFFSFAAHIVIFLFTADETEISFDPGDIITQIDKVDEGERFLQEKNLKFFF